jgi:hypothetical protein
MTTDPTELYPVISQIAVAFAGFGSLASGLRRRRGADDAKLDAFRLFSMLQVSITTTILGLVPATLVGVGVEERWAVGGPAAATLAIIAYRTPIAVKRGKELRQVPGYNPGSALLNNICLLVAVVAFALCALGIPKERVEGLYLVGLMAVLGMSANYFSRVITSMLRPHSRAGD